VRWHLLGVGAALTASASVGAAQSVRTCLVVVDRTGGEGRQVAVGGGVYHVFQSGGIWAHCRGEETQWYSDSIAWYQDIDRFDMVGHVDFQDGTAHMTSERASYFLHDERLHATGNARLVNLVTRSVLRGPEITYFRRVAGLRDTTRLVAGQRPTIEYHSERDSAGAEPYLIVADRVQLVGNSAASSWGNVTIDRSDFHAKADSATLDTEVGTGDLMSHAEVRGGDSTGYTLTGRNIQYRLEDRALRWVQAEQEAVALSADWKVQADTVAFDIVDDRIQAGNAWGDSTQAVATSVTNTITADSLAIDAPGQILTTVRGIGAARATTRLDSLDQERDWIAGDTVVAHFAPTLDRRTAISGIEAMGKASAYYRVFPEGGQDSIPDLSYSRGERIVAAFANDRLVRVDIVGKADGVYLEGRRRKQP
jgi:lipopolysaccharide export system protein LptA